MIRNEQERRVTCDAIIRFCVDFRQLQRSTHARGTMTTIERRAIQEQLNDLIDDLIHYDHEHDADNERTAATAPTPPAPVPQ